MTPNEFEYLVFFIQNYVSRSLYTSFRLAFKCKTVQKKILVIQRDILRVFFHRAFVENLSMRRSAVQMTANDQQTRFLFLTTSSILSKQKKKKL